MTQTTNYKLLFLDFYDATKVELRHNLDLEEQLDEVYSFLRELADVCDAKDQGLTRGTNSTPASLVEWARQLFAQVRTPQMNRCLDRLMQTFRIGINYHTDECFIITMPE